MYLNGEVEPCPLCGLKYCIFGMFEGRHVQDLISQQLQKYEHGEGAFKDGSTLQGLQDASPTEWWSRYGAQCPELQKLSIRIPSQTCDGILGFDLKRSLTEELLSRKKTTNQIDYEYLLDTTYVQCNVQLQNTKSKALSDLYALCNAFKEACACPTPSKVLIPKGTFLLAQVSLEGPCKAPVKIVVRGTLKAPTDLSKMKADGSWVTFQHIDRLTLSGGGTFDGQGSKAWGTCGLKSYCKQLPINLRFNFITNAIVEDITSKDSKQFHVNVLGCNNLTFGRFTISAPEHSLNTDGIHIGRSTGINITDSNIGTGDDCVSIGDGSRQITITNVTCGPGHGISVGSLGKYMNEEPVVGVTVRNCSFFNTMNGVRIKTWPASFQGSVSDMHFEDIIMNNVSSPVIIDQIYCPHNECNAKLPSLVRISNVSFKNIRGTSSTPVAVKLACSSCIPCRGVEISDIDLRYTGKEAGAAVSECSNVRPKIFGKHSLTICT
ncbi:hypothetical protein LWI28_006484 [Acer negundo]|uniref:Exopolygalacturonase n=1 Tax=Acer negundo TaxID=4023 RepID=A0AAD5ICN8_ACENE|nr:hypothetical protein LWI28_006484 [Acer negundo]